MEILETRELKSGDVLSPPNVIDNLGPWLVGGTPQNSPIDVLHPDIHIELWPVIVGYEPQVGDTESIYDTSVKSE